MSWSGARFALRWRLFAGAIGFGAVAQGACGIDDRQLSSAGLAGNAGAGGGGNEQDVRQCNSPGDNACETCLYENCCAEVRACAPGSRCVEYFDCAGACNGDETCLNACARDSPVGFGNAVALGVCSQTRCSVCSGSSAPFEGCDASGPGTCENEADCSALQAGALENLDVPSCSACDPNLTAPACVSCLATQSGLSQGCAACVASWVSCAVRGCSYACEGSADVRACEQCLSNAGCTAALASCGFSR